MPTIKTYIYLTDRDGAEHEVAVRVDCDATYQSARTYGPPEDCYPEEGEMTLNSIEAIGDLSEGISEDDLTQMEDDQVERITEEAWDAYHATGMNE